MNSTTSYGLSDYQARTLAIESTGFCDRSMIRPGNCIVRVPFSSLSQTMQSIHRMGGKVAQVTLLSPGGEAVGTAVSQAPTPTASPAHKLLEKISLRGQSPQQSPPPQQRGTITRLKMVVGLENISEDSRAIKESLDPK